MAPSLPSFTPSRISLNEHGMVEGCGPVSRAGPRVEGVPPGLSAFSVSTRAVLQLTYSACISSVARL
jgi:hypothetical protein